MTSSPVDVRGGGDDLQPGIVERLAGLLVHELREPLHVADHVRLPREQPEPPAGPAQVPPPDSGLTGRQDRRFYFTASVHREGGENFPSRRVHCLEHRLSLDHRQPGRGYCWFVIETRPYVLLSCATSADGYLDDASPDRLILSGPADLDRVDELRASCDAIMVGAGTVRKDNPRLLIRDPRRVARRAARGQTPSPLRVVLTRGGAPSPAAAVFTAEGAETVVLSTADGGLGPVLE